MKLSGSVERRPPSTSSIAGLEQQVDALARADFEVVLALGADVQVGCEIGLADGLAAARALDPEAFGADSLLAVVGAVAAGAGSNSPFSRLNQDIAEDNCI